MLADVRPAIVGLPGPPARSLTSGYGRAVLPLLHLNGPPGIGKSTLAALWAERTPGRWTWTSTACTGSSAAGATRTRTPTPSSALSRSAMAAAYLDGGHDVVLPQYLGRLAEVEAFERIAHERGPFREVVLLDDRDAAVERFERRRDDTAWDAHNRRVVADLGGDAFLGVHARPAARRRRGRPSAVVVRSEAGDVERPTRRSSEARRSATRPGGAAPAVEPAAARTDAGSG